MKILVNYTMRIKKKFNDTMTELEFYKSELLWKK